MRKALAVGLLIGSVFLFTERATRGQDKIGTRLAYPADLVSPALVTWQYRYLPPGQAGVVQVLAGRNIIHSVLLPGGVETTILAGPSDVPEYRIAAVAGGPYVVPLDIEVESGLWIVANNGGWTGGVTVLYQSDE